MHELRQPEPDRKKLEKCCVVCLKFSVDHYDLLRTPCWVVIVHLVAIELLNLVLPRGKMLLSTFSGFNPINVLFEDNEFSSPSSSFVGGHPGSFLQRQSIIDRQLGVSGAEAFHSNNNNGANNNHRNPHGRANRGGVFKRIVRKEDIPFGPSHNISEFGSSPGLNYNFRVRS